MARAHSYSAMKTYNTCPRQYEALYLLRSHKRAPSPALEKGIKWHEALEGAVRDGTPLPDYLKSWQPLATMLHEAGAVPEVKLAVTRDMTPCDFWDKEAWLRGAIDVDLTIRDTTMMLDWKTGKVYPDPTQADVYAVMKWAQAPEQKISFKFVYLEHAQSVPEAPRKDAIERVQAQLTRMEEAKKYPPRPCFACRFCPVANCEYHRG